ncbi:MAG: phosphate signaling complex protein PhoU [Armatimonadetes bacterium]|nr:phosphate signaling complex protein PhoU [Armatimonadota bacterium]
MRIHYEERLLDIRSHVIAMGNQAHEMVRKASESVITSNPGLANEVIREDDAVDVAERKTIMEAITFVVQESPVASDLRFLVSTLGVVGEIEEVADDAVKLARRSLKLGTNFPATMKKQLNELSEVSRLQFMSALRLYSEFDPDLARSIVDRDNEVDSAYSRARDQLLEMFKEDANNAGGLVRTIEVFHALEHVSDHAVSIAKRMQMIDEPPPGV